MTYDFSTVLKGYPELLRWPHLQKIFGQSRRTLERRRADGKMRGIVFVDPFKEGRLQATKESVIRFLEDRAERTAKDLTPPSIESIRGRRGGPHGAETLQRVRAHDAG